MGLLLMLNPVATAPGSVFVLVRSWYPVATAPGSDTAARTD
jgi:hypothetical protein